MSEWRPIETAPKDGTRILLFVPPPWSDRKETGHSVGAFYDKWWLTCVRAGSTVDIPPTHWMPLPEPPRG